MTTVLSTIFFEHFKMATWRHRTSYDASYRTKAETKLFVKSIISRVILHQKLKNMEFRGKNLIHDFFVEFRKSNLF